MEQIATAAITTLVPVKFHKRVKIVAKRNRMAIAQLARLAIEEKTKQLEDQEKELDEKIKPKRVGLHVVPHDERPPVEIPVAETFDRLAAVFDDQADKIMSVHTHPEMLERQKQEAFAAIKRLAPLTYADDRKIIARLESVIAEKASQEPTPEPDSYTTPMFYRPPSLSTPPAPAMSTPDKFAALMAPFANALMQPPQGAPDPFIGKTINTSRVRSRGVVEVSDNEEDDQ